MLSENMQKKKKAIITNLFFRSLKIANKVLLKQVRAGTKKGIRTRL
jgi:hypothetical protein